MNENRGFWVKKE